MCTVEVPTCRPLCLAEVMRKVYRVRNLLNRRNDNNNGNGRDASAVYEDTRNVRRALFNDGPIDHEARAQFLNLETERMRRDTSRRWNFDFETETPLIGRFQWTRVDSSGLSEPTTASTEVVAVEQPSPIEEPVPELIPVPSSSTVPEAPKPKSKSTRKAARQSRLTDYMPQRKRSSTSSPKPSKASSHSPESKVRRTTAPSSSTSSTA